MHWELKIDTSPLFFKQKKLEQRMDDTGEEPKQLIPKLKRLHLQFKYCG